MRANNVLEMLQTTVEKYPDKPAIQWKENGGAYQKISYGDFWKRIQHFAYGLAHYGIKPDDKIALISNSNPMWGISDFALASLRAVSVPIYPTIPSEQIAYILEKREITAAIVENKEQYEKLLATGIKLNPIIVMYPEGVEDERSMTFREVENVGSNHPLPDWEDNIKKITRDQLLTIMNTSGTTGYPKGVMLTHGNILANVEGTSFWIYDLTSKDVSLSYLPLSHIFERLAGHYLPLSAGVTISYAESIQTITENLQEIKPTIMTSVPRLFEKVYAAVVSQIESGSGLKKKIFDWAIKVGEERYDYYVNASVTDFLNQEYLPKDFYKKWKRADKLVFQKIKQQLGGRLRGLISGGGTLNPDIARFFWALDIPIFEGYGLTETSPVISTNPHVRAKVGTIGRVLPNLEVKIADDGEILVRGPSITQGYYKDPEETAAAFEGDWFKTGDIGEFDEDGYLKIIDRKKRIFVLSTGMNVAPASVENAINESPYIGQTLAIGDNRKYIVALVNPDFEILTAWAKEKGVDTDNLEEMCKDPVVQKLIKKEVTKLTKKLSNYAQPKKIIIISDVWSIDSGELTPKLSLKAEIIEETYKNEIENAYTEEAKEIIVV